MCFENIESMNFHASILRLYLCGLPTHQTFDVLTPFHQLLRRKMKMTH